MTARKGSTFTVRANSGQYQSEMKKAKKSTEDTSRAQKALKVAAGLSRKSMDAFVDRLKIGHESLNRYGKAAVAAGAALTAGIVAKGLASGDQLAKQADKLGLTTEALARYRFQAQQTGVDQAKADVAMQRFTRRLADAAAGAGPAVKAFDALGLEATELVNLSPDVAFAKVADQMNKVESQSQKVSLAFKLFDSEGVGLVNTLALGSEGLSELALQADAAGLSLSRVDAAQIENANDAIARVKSAFTGFSQQLAVRFAPLLTRVADYMFGVGQEAGGMADIAGKAFDFMVKAAGVFADGIGVLRVGWTTMKIAFQGAATFIVKGLQTLTNAATDMYNALPWVDDVEYTRMFSGFLASMESEIDSSQAKLRELLSTELPSVSIKRWTATMERQSERAASAAVDANIAIQDAVISTESVTESLSTKTSKSTKQITEDWRGSTGLITGFIRDLETDGLGAFTNLLQGFRSMIQNMVLEGSQNPVPVVLSAVGAGGAVAVGGGAAGVGASGGAGGLSGGLSSIAGLGKSALGLISGGFAGFGTNVATGLSSIGLGNTVVGFQNAGSFFAPNASGVTQVGIGSLANLGAGFAGSFVANKLVGETSGIGSGLGGLAGTVLGAGNPVFTALGTVAGAALEKGLGKVFGFGQNNGNNQGFTAFNFATGQRDSQGVGKSFNQDNVDASSAFVDALQAFSQQIGGSNFAGRLEIGNRSGISFVGEGAAGQFGQDTAAALQFGFRKIIEEATALDEAIKPLILSFRGTGEELAVVANAYATLNAGQGVNTVTQALEDFAAVQPTLYQRVQESNTALRESIASYDGSAQGLAVIANQYDINKAAGYEYVLSLQAVGKGLTEQAAIQARQIRESVLNADELTAARQAEFDELSRSFASLVDPERIAEVGQRRLELSAVLFRDLPEEQRTKAEAERAAVRAETIAQETQAAIDAVIGSVQQQQVDRDAETRRLLVENQQFQRETAQIERETAQQNRATAQETNRILQETAAALTDFVRGGGRTNVPRLDNFDL